MNRQTLAQGGKKKEYIGILIKKKRKVKTREWLDIPDICLFSSCFSAKLFLSLLFLISSQAMIIFFLRMIFSPKKHTKWMHYKKWYFNNIILNRRTQQLTEVSSDKMSSLKNITWNTFELHAMVGWAPSNSLSSMYANQDRESIAFSATPPTLLHMHSFQVFWSSLSFGLYLILSIFYTL